MIALAIAASDKLLTDVMLNVDNDKSDYDSDNKEEIGIKLKRKINVRN